MGLSTANKLASTHATPIARDSEAPIDPNSDPNTLQDWFEELPLMNPAVCVEHVLHALVACNALTLDVKQRFALLALYRRQSARQFQAFSTAAFQRTLTAQTRDQVIRDISFLLLELARGFTLLIRQGERSAQWDPTSPFIHAIYGTMQALGYAILHAIRTHTPLPPATHLELNRLYALAEQRDCIRAPVGPAKELCAPCIGDLYKQIQLLTAIDPFAIPESDLLAVFAQLGAYSAVCPLALERPADAKEQVLVIDLAVNAVAFALQSREEMASCTEPRFLSLGPVLRAAARTEQNREKSAQHRVQARNAGFIRTLLRKKTKQDRNALQRVPDREIRATFGLEAVHYFLRDDARRLRQALRESGETMQIRRRANNGLAKLQTLLLEDKEAGAYRLRQPGLGHIDARAGELIAMTAGTADGPFAFELGIVMWARHDRQDRLHFAVKCICTGTVPAICKQAGKSDRNGETPSEVPCLYVPRVNSRTGRSLLLAPNHTKWELLPIWLDMTEKTKLVNLGERRSDIASIACYEIPGKG